VSLSVDVFVVDQDGGARVLDTEGASDLAGVERTRTELWGSSTVRGLGARFLPSLAEQDLWVYPEDLDAFRAECEMVSACLSKIAEGTGYVEEYVGSRLANILQACTRARGVGGGVVVW
jgi:hypothetical protein